MHRYRISKTIGDGTYGSVLLATDYTGTQVAIKKMKKKYRSFRECMELKEITSLMQLSHVNIVQMHEVLRDHSGDLYFSFEFADCNLYQFTKQHIQGTQSGGGGNGGNQGVIQHKAGKLLSPLLVRNLMYSVMQGLAFMHRHDYFHRDMKPENILCNHSGGQVKLADMGLVRHIRSQPPATDYVSTRWYRAPEVLLRSTTYSAGIDVFACACIWAELITGQPLFPGATEADQLQRIAAVLGVPTQQNWSEGMKLAAAIKFKFAPVALQQTPQLTGLTPLQLLQRRVPQASPSALRLMLAMLSYDAKQRPTAQQILQHEYFRVGQDMLPGSGALPAGIGGGATANVTTNNDTAQPIDEVSEELENQQSNSTNPTRNSQLEQTMSDTDLDQALTSAIDELNSARRRETHQDDSQSEGATVFGRSGVAGCKTWTLSDGVLLHSRYFPQETKFGGGGGGSASKRSAASAGRRQKANSVAVPVVASQAKHASHNKERHSVAVKSSFASTLGSVASTSHSPPASREKSQSQQSSTRNRMTLNATMGNSAVPQTHVSASNAAVSASQQDNNNNSLASHLAQKREKEREQRRISMNLTATLLGNAATQVATGSSRNSMNEASAATTNAPSAAAATASGGPVSSNRSSIAPTTTQQSISSPVVKPAVQSQAAQRVSAGRQRSSLAQAAASSLK